MLEDYFLNKADHLATKGTARNAGRLMLECWGDLIQTGAITDAQQKKFVLWSLEKPRHHSLGTIARNLGVLAAALVQAKLAIWVTYTEGGILAKWPEIRPKPPRKTYEPTEPIFAVGC